MATWRLLALGWAGILVLAVAAGMATSLPAVVPPVLAAGVVLLGAAVACDYFGIVRRAIGWHGRIIATPSARSRVAALQHRFRCDRERGCVTTGATARSLLVALAELGELGRSSEVVDFLHADALTRAHRDVVGDGLRALALAELGRLPQARRVLATLEGRDATHPVVVWAQARVAELEGQPHRALRILAVAVPEGPRLSPALRDLALEQARLLVRVGADEQARVVLGRVARDGWRRDVEALLDRGDPTLGLAVQEALGVVAAYR